MANTFNTGTLGRQRKAVICEFEASWDYIGSLRPVRVT